MTSSDDGPGGNFVEACCSAQALTVFNSVVSEGTGVGIEGVGGGGGGRGGGSAGGRGVGVGGGSGDVCDGGDEVDS